ncbi:MAG: metallophosphoesterase family protein, partial [Chloroflexota bacterium]|nr:metallophosphoesterase family protein [Chloroflexota bacterium]
VWFLGDLVGYGPDPNECVEWMRSVTNLTALAGNHDVATLGKINIDTFNIEARQAIHWTQETISQENLDYLDKLPTSVQLEDFTLAHGSPRQPVWEYVINSRTAFENMAFLSTPYCLVGHSHLPTIFEMERGDSHPKLLIPTNDMTYALNQQAIINPGSVGQPRDRDPRAAYALLDTESKEIEFRRVAYDITSVQARMQEAGLPSRHIGRLETGW